MVAFRNESGEIRNPENDQEEQHLRDDPTWVEIEGSAEVAKARLEEALAESPRGLFVEILEEILDSDESRANPPVVPEKYFPALSGAFDKLNNGGRSEEDNRRILMGLGYQLPRLLQQYNDRYAEALASIDNGQEEIDTKLNNFASELETVEQEQQALESKKRNLAAVIDKLYDDKQKNDARKANYEAEYEDIQSDLAG